MRLERGAFGTFAMPGLCGFACPAICLGILGHGAILLLQRRQLGWQGAQLALYCISLSFEGVCSRTRRPANWGA